MKNDKEWSQSVAGLAADALFQAHLISDNQLHLVADIIEEEVFVRLCLGDRPEGDSSDVLK